MSADKIPDGYVAIARVIGAWGVRGDVKAEVLAPPTVLKKGRSVLVAGSETTVERATSAGKHTRIKFRDVAQREDASALRNAWVLVREEELPRPPEGEYYRFQLLGIRVRTTEGRELGTIADIFSTPENDVYVVRGEKEILIPAVEDVVTEIDLASGAITVEAIPGLLPDS
jgi:16S rRNA processing protein RimM